MFELTPFVKRNHVTTYDPFRLFDEMERSFFKGSELGDFRADIRDTGDAYELEADLPGVKKEDIKVDLDNNYLTISAERHAEKDEKDKKGNYVRRERSYGSYSRSFDVTGVQTEQITAEYTDGVLKLHLPKKQEALPTTRRLEIR
ncbi:MAG TPA: Hsp20/alpha crystallin family protein [Candidatus Aphodomorpha intestinavium]|uniref:Hsp20/alpha crystallin family protein n=1 Tax=Candidatus Aphodomorpha intestinavium TaxID=2840672 RepID=A0A9D1N424_9FIRM|nr:Hsp20/alpha crystallin family protein [Candidatus Aphodomorpha intestinavium]